jgi:AcrR family transcriptional regulator
MATVVRPPIERVTRDQRRASIVRAAGRLFARDGYAAARLEDIAAAADVTKPIVYRHFDSKKALYLALLEKHEADLPTFIEGVEAPPGGADAEALLRAILDGWLDYVWENQHAWVMLFRDSSGDEEIRAVRLQVSRRARQVMAGFIAAQPGARVPPDQVEATAELLTSGLAGLALWWIDHPDAPKALLVDVAVRASLGAVGGLGASPDASAAS